MTPKSDALIADVTTLPDPWGLVMLDRALADGEVSPRDLADAAAGSADRVRWLVAIADARATANSHSVLRLAWYGADLPTPSVGLTLRTPRGAVATVCATEYHRFAVALEATPDQRSWLARRGWRVLVVHEDRLLGGDMPDLTAHVRREHLQHLASAGIGRSRKGGSRQARARIAS